MPGTEVLRIGAARPCVLTPRWRDAQPSYGFWQLGQIALMAAIASYIAAALMLVLSVFGFVHLRRTAPEAVILPAIATRVQVSAS